MKTTYAVSQEFPAGSTGWRTFPQHYLLYASRGMFQLEVAGSRWFLPPQKAALIASHTEIRVGMSDAVACRSVLFDPSSLLNVAPCRVFSMTPLAREMVHHTMKWGPDHDDPAAPIFFQALAQVVGELAQSPDLFWLPTSQTPGLAKAIDHTLAQLGRPLSQGEVASVAGLSERTMARRFLTEANMTWKEFLHRARMIRAMELLADSTRGVTEVVYATGFESPGSFTRAFSRFVGEPPSVYRRRFLPVTPPA